MNKRQMRYMDWRTIYLFTYAFGGLFFLVGVYVYFYYETDLIGYLGLEFNTYQNFAIPLVTAGIALLITGLIAEKRAINRIECVEKQETTANTGVCPNCKAKRDLDDQYCRKCGKKFE
ncbi:MAG TPA: hypothetical protein VEF91_00495 [Verrucomicrobiae bacterium]|nr:hypothetical protein [Verrucomicrobiae bacterium]